MAAPALTTFEQGRRLAEAIQKGEVPENKIEEAKAALADLRERLEKEKLAPGQRVEQENQARITELSTALNTLADNPVGRQARDPRMSTGPLGRITEPAPTEDFVLANQARERGIDISTGASMDQRFGQGLASLKDPQLRFNMLDSHYREELYKAGVEWPEGVPVVMHEQQTGKLAYVRPITKDDVVRLGDSPENVGRTRLTLVDPEGIDLGDMAEWLPSISIAAGETGGAVVAGLLKSPQAASFASAGITATIEALASPIKDKLLKDYYGVTEEELRQFSDPNEALHQALLAGGLDLAMGQGMIFSRWLKNKSNKRTLTEDDYNVLVEELDALRDINAAFKTATDESIADPLMFVEAASKRLDTTSGQSIGTKGMNFLKRLPEKFRRSYTNIEDVTRLKLARGFRTINNRSVQDAADPESLATLGTDANGLVRPTNEITENAEAALKLARDEYGVTYARNSVRQGEDEAMNALDELHDRVSTGMFKDVQQLTANDVALMKTNEDLQWAYFKSFLEPNATGTEFGIKLVNGKNSPVRRALGRLDSEAVRNLSKSMGDRTKGFVEDLSSLRGDTLDINQLQRLRSDLLRAKRKLDLGTDTSGWTANELNDVIDAIDDTIATQDWVRASTGRKVPGVRREALNQWQKAREATTIWNRYASEHTVMDMINTIKTVDVAQARVHPTRRQFTMQPQQVRDMLFRPGDATALANVMEISGRHPGFRAALANELEGIYKNMALNPDGTFARGGYNEFMQQYGDHVEKLFGPERAARLTSVDQMQREVGRLNEVAKKVEDAFKATFGDAVDPSKLGSQGVIHTLFSSSNVTTRQARNLMNRVRQIDPALYTELRAEAAQWVSNKLAKSPVQLKDGNAIRTLLDENSDKLTAVFGQQWMKDMRSLQLATEVVDLSAMARGTSEPVQAAWLQITRSVMGPLSRKQRFLTAFNRVTRGRAARKTIDLMSDPKTLRQFVQLRELNPKSVAFWSTIDALGLRWAAEENGIYPPSDINTMKVKEESLRRLAQGGPL